MKNLKEEFDFLMPYRLQSGANLAPEIRRIAGEQIDRAIESIQAGEIEPEESIHDLRKRCKKLRAVVRLVRDELGDDVYKRENRFFRDIARRYSDRRDRWAFIENLEEILASPENGKEHPLRRELSALRDGLIEYHRAQMEPGKPEGFAEVKSLLEKSKERCADWPIGGNDFDTLAPSIKRVYRRGRKAMAKAHDDPVPEKMHEWRKRGKYLWYHYRLLERIWPDYLGFIVKKQHALTDLLGDEHDLAELGDLVKDRPELAGGDSNAEKLLSFFEEEREKIRDRVWLPGRRLYAEKPKKFVKRLGRYWETA